MGHPAVVAHLAELLASNEKERVQVPSTAPHAFVAQSEERRPRNAQATGSTPVEGSHVPVAEQVDAQR